MTKNVFIVKFDASITEPDKLIYLNLIKNEWKYPSVSNMLNTIVEGMLAGELLIIKVKKEIIEKLNLRLASKNYDIDDWLKECIRNEIGK